MTLRLNGSTSGYSEIQAPAVAGDQTFTLPGTGGVLDRLERAGNILQVVNGTLATTESTTNNTYTDTGLSATITPTFSTSKVLVLVSASSVVVNASSRGVSLDLTRDSTSIVVFAQYLGYSSSYESYNPSTAFLDSPSTTSAVTYKVRFKVSTGSATAYFSDNNSTSTITLLEVAA